MILSGHSDMAASNPAAGSAGKPGSSGFVVAFLMTTLVAAGAGFAAAQMGAVPQSLVPQAGEPPKVELNAKPDAHGAPAGKKDDAAHAPPFSGVRELPAIVTNLAIPETVWLRLESSIVLDRVDAKDVENLLQSMSGDALAFIRTMSLPQLQGASGLAHLRDDLMERMSIRSSGRARALVIHSLVVQ